MDPSPKPVLDQRLLGDAEGVVFLEEGTRSLAPWAALVLILISLTGSMGSWS